MMQFFHEVMTDEKFKEMVKKKKNWDDVNAEFKQPDWCSYPEALSNLGCWSLTGFMIDSKTDCGNCDCIKTKYI